MKRCQHCGAEHAPETMTCPATDEPMANPGPCGGRIDRYEILHLLGMGGFGGVYRARHVHTEQVVALKLVKRQLSTDTAMLERLLREARAAAAVGSPHIVRVLDAGVVPDGQAFLAMELLDGWDLKEMAYRIGPLSLERTVRLVLQVLAGLSAAHAKGIVHRDMKPANVFVTTVVGEDGQEQDFVKLLDFGISKAHQAAQEAPVNALTLPGMAMGTPAYMAPEQFVSARDVDARADLYSVAVMLYELLAGRLPFEAKSFSELLVKVSTQTPPPLLSVAPGLPPQLAAVVDRGLSREASARWQDAGAFSDALRAAMGLARPSQRPAPARPAERLPPELSLSATHTPPARPASAPDRPASPQSFMDRTAPTPQPRSASAGGPMMAAPPAVSSEPVVMALPVVPPAPRPAQAAVVQAAPATPVPPTRPKSSSRRWWFFAAGLLLLFFWCGRCS